MAGSWLALTSSFDCQINTLWVHGYVCKARSSNALYRVSGGHVNAFCGLPREWQLQVKGDQPCRTGGRPVNHDKCPPTLWFLPSEEDVFSVWEMYLPVSRVLTASPVRWDRQGWACPKSELGPGVLGWIAFSQNSYPLGGNLWLWPHLERGSLQM